MWLWRNSKWTSFLTSFINQLIYHHCINCTFTEKMKKTIVNRILPYLIVLIGTFILGFFVLFFKSHSTSTKTKFDFVRSLYPSDFIVQKISPFDSLNIGKNTLLSFDNYVLLKDNSTTDRDLCMLMNGNGEKLENIVIPERSVGIISYIDSCVFWISLKFYKTIVRDNPGNRWRRCLQTLSK